MLGEGDTVEARGDDVETHKKKKSLIFIPDCQHAATKKPESESIL